MTLEEEKHKRQVEDQQKWKKAFATVVKRSNPQIEEWKRAFQEVLANHSAKVQIQPNIDVWKAAFKSVIDSWNVNPASALSGIVQQNSPFLITPVKLVQQVTIGKRKDDWADIKNTLDANNITCFYHFTDSSNLSSIRQNGGLYSWYSCEKKGIHISHPGGSPNSRMLDSLYDLQDYVRLSFCDDHPMAYRHMQDGANLVLLKISTDVAGLQGTLFSNINATAKGHSVGDSIDDLKRVDFKAVKKHYVSRNDPDFSTHQAECMVKTFVPKEYILNLDSPLNMLL
ncbi:MAG: DUF4433 domain-containing protein [Bacteroidales bacterium]|nr:DUF4433 domain-containing protein [Bacteroidales bacterium]